MKTFLRFIRKRGLQVLFALSLWWFSLFLIMLFEPIQNIINAIGDPLEEILLIIFPCLVTWAICWKWPRFLQLPDTISWGAFLIKLGLSLVLAAFALAALAIGLVWIDFEYDPTNPQSGLEFWYAGFFYAAFASPPLALALAWYWSLRASRRTSS